MAAATSAEQNTALKMDIFEWTPLWLDAGEDGSGRPESPDSTAEFVLNSSE
jgi:hypothetical protein